MKKILLLLTFLSFTYGFAQCYIEGNSSITVGETETYTLKNNAGQCTDCHHWSTFARNVTLQGDVKQSIIKVNAHGAGQFILSMDMLSPRGKVQCSKVIDVVPKPSAEIYNSPVCDIGTEGFKEVKISDGTVSFVPSKAETHLKYEWTAEYDNGEKKISAESAAQFAYSKEKGIRSVSLKVYTSKCMRTFTKTYDANYWRFY